MIKSRKRPGDAIVTARTTWSVYAAEDHLGRVRGPSAAPDLPTIRRIAGAHWRPGAILRAVSSRRIVRISIAPCGTTARIVSVTFRDHLAADASSAR